jgi:hypothetical protein
MRAAASIALVPVVILLLSTPSAPRAASLAFESKLPLIGSGGGSSFTRRCPDNHVLTGFRWRQGAVVDAIGIKCRPVQSDGRLGNEISSGSMAGGDGGTFGSKSCEWIRDGRTSQIVVTYQRGGGAGIGIASLTFACRPWLPESRASGGGQIGELLQIRSGSVFTRDLECPRAGEPAVGIYGRQGAIVDAVGLICALP